MYSLIMNLSGKPAADEKSKTCNFSSNPDYSGAEKKKQNLNTLEDVHSKT